MANLAPRPRIGLEAVSYAILTESSDVVGGTATYGTITPLANAIQLGLDQQGTVTTLFAEDGPAFLGDTVGEMKLNFNVADLLPQDEANIFGHTYSGGQVQKLVTDQSPYVAIWCKRLRAGQLSGAVVYDYVFFPKVKFAKPKEEAKTKGAKIEYQTPMAEGNVAKLISVPGLYMNKTRTDDDNVAASVLANWFTTIPLPSNDLTALSVSIAKGTGGDSGKIVYTFSKVSGLSFGIVADSVTANSVTVQGASGSLPGTYAVGSAGTTVIVKFTPTSAFTGGENVGTSVTNDVQDNQGVRCTENGIVLTY